MSKLQDIRDLAQEHATLVSSETIPVSFYRPVTDPRTASTGNRLCVPGTVE